MSFINFNNRKEDSSPTYSADVIKEALNLVETKNTNRIEKMLEGVNTPLSLNEALTFFTTGKINAMVALTTAAVAFESDLNLPAEELESDLEDTTPEVKDADGKKYVKAEDRSEETEEVEDELVDGEDGAKEVAKESYKNEIASKLSNLVEAATKKENENPTFFKIVSNKVQEKYNALNEDAKIEVRRSVSKRGFMTEGQIESIIESSNLIVENKNATPYFIDAMPKEYGETWKNLSEAKKNQITAQSKYHSLNTEYQVRNFWETRDLRESAKVMEKLNMITESKVEEKKGLGYDATAYTDSFKKRFNK